MPAAQSDQIAPHRIQTLRPVVLGVAASDAHAVANQIIERDLTERGFYVINLGVCTPLHTFARALAAHPGAEALLIGSLNGHAISDLAELPRFISSGQICCPVIVGGNVGVGPVGSELAARRLRELGVDHVLDSAQALPALLDLYAERTGQQLVSAAA